MQAEILKEKTRIYALTGCKTRIASCPASLDLFGRHDIRIPLSPNGRVTPLFCSQNDCQLHREKVDRGPMDKIFVLITVEKNFAFLAALSDEFSCFRFSPLSVMLRNVTIIAAKTSLCQRE